MTPLVSQSWTLALSALLAALACATPTMAQVDGNAPAHADNKATARHLALEGIEHFKAEQYAEALDRLSRAQQLFEAPVHLLYMARSEEKLGRLVEAAEHYRALVRTVLEEDAPAAFVNAVRDGREELTALEPRIPALTILVSPKRPKKLLIDGRRVPTAAIGARRPTNPGKHRIRVERPGYKPTTRSVQLAEGQTKELKLRLKVDPNYVPPKKRSSSSKAGEPEEDEPLFLGFLLGLRLEGAWPGGQAGQGVPLREGNGAPPGFNADPTELSAYMNPGGGLELRGGARVWEQVSAILFFQGGSLGSGDLLEEERERQVHSSTLSYSTVGIGLLGEMQLRRLLGIRLHGELDWTFTQTIEIQREFPPSAGESSKCQYTQAFSGGGLRLGFGASYPITKEFHVGPLFSMSVGQFDKAEYTASPGCGNETPVDLFDGSQGISSADRQGHRLIHVGLGVEYLFGG